MQALAGHSLYRHNHAVRPLLQASAPLSYLPNDGLTGSNSESEGPLWEVATSHSTCLCSRITGKVPRVAQRHESRIPKVRGLLFQIVACSPLSPQTQLFLAGVAERQEAHQCQFAMLRQMPRIIK